MNSFGRTTVNIFSCALFTGLLIGCQQSDRPGPGPLEKAGKKADKAVDEMNQDAKVVAEKARVSIEEAGKKAGKAADEFAVKAEKAGEEAKDRAKKVGAAVEETAKEIGKDVKEGARKIAEATPVPTPRR